jgi:hypothetical protein
MTQIGQRPKFQQDPESVELFVGNPLGNSLVLGQTAVELGQSRWVVGLKSNARITQAKPLVLHVFWHLGRRANWAIIFHPDAEDWRRDARN